MADNPRKRAAEETDTNKDSTDSAVDDFRVRDIMQGINSIQNTLANFMMRLDGQGRDLDDLTKEVRKRNGINERLENVQEQANDTLYTISELQDRQKNMLEIQKRYSERQIETKVKGDKLVFTQSNSVYRDKVGSRPTIWAG